MGLLRFLFIFGLIYFGFRFIFRKLIPWLLGRYVRKARQKFQDQQQSSEPEFREGEVHISRTRDSDGSSKEGDGGDYVDYEEVKD